tara:strand:+ start:565 stop:1488 length:924 start_codon:yes stop_codon:yes gene_type:complete
MKSKILVLNKSKGTSSNNQLQKIKKILNVKKAGFSGTLDPLAKGVLPIFTDNMTKVIKHLDDNLKVYKLKALLGFKTDTLDICGNVISYDSRDKLNCLNYNKIREAIKSFEGEFEYYPPKFSAKKFKGERYYSLARKKESFNIKKIKSNISSIILNNISNSSFELIVECTRGTYIRSLVESIGNKLGVCTTLSELERIKSGPFQIDESVSLYDVKFKNNFYYDICKLFNTITINNKLLNDILGSNNYKKVNIRLISDSLYNKIISLTSGDEKKILNIILSESGDERLLMTSFFSTNGKYDYSHVEIL